MKRDFDLLRRLVLEVEASPTACVEDEIKIEGYTREQVAYHCYLLVDAGYAKGIEFTTINDSGPNSQVLHLTSAGHDFADAIRSESTWRKVTSLVKERGAGVTLDVLKQVAISVVKDSLGL